MSSFSLSERLPRDHGHHPANQIWVIVRGSPAAAIAALFLVSVAALAAAPSLFGVADPLLTNPREAFAPPSWAAPFGTDDLGRDLFSRTIYGGRVSLGTAVVVVVGASLVGVPIGLLAGYTGGWVDAILMRLIDVLLAFPAILLAMGLIAVLGQGLLNAAIAVVVVSTPGFARLARGSMLAERERDYVLAARALGATDARIIARTALPNCLGPLIVQAAFVATFAVLLEAGLSFLGLGVAPPTPSWGQMLSQGKDFLYRAWWFGFFPGLVLTCVVLAFNALGEFAQTIVNVGWRGSIRSRGR